MVTHFIRPFSFVQNFMRFWASYLIWHGTFLDLAARTNYSIDLWGGDFWN